MFIIGIRSGRASVHPFSSRRSLIRSARSSLKTPKWWAPLLPTRQSCTVFFTGPQKRIGALSKICKPFSEIATLQIISLAWKSFWSNSFDSTDPSPSFTFSHCLSVSGMKGKYLLMSSIAYRMAEPGQFYCKTGVLYTLVLLAPLHPRVPFLLSKDNPHNGPSRLPILPLPLSPSLLCPLHLVADLLQDLSTECLGSKFSVPSKPSQKVSTFSLTWLSASQYLVIWSHLQDFCCTCMTFVLEGDSISWAETKRVPF